MLAMKKDYRLPCPKCGAKMWLAPPSMREEGIYFCEKRECNHTESQSELHERIKREREVTP